MRYIITIPYLKSLYIQLLIRSETMAGFSTAKSLEVFRCGVGLNESDFLEISQCSSLHIIGAQSSDVTHRVTKALIEMPQLINLDIENSDFNDEMAKVISESKTLLSLEVGGTFLTGAGLNNICRMKQLQVLDLWNTEIKLDDLDLLVKLPCLEYLSVGHGLNQSPMCVNQLIEKLEALPSLKRIWLDGVKITEKQKMELEKRFEAVQISPPEEE